MSKQNLDKLRELYKLYNLTPEDVYKHKHYTIITRTGIDKIVAKESIDLHYDVVSCDPEFAAVKCTGTNGAFKIQSFGSAKKGGKVLEKGTNGGKDRWVALGNTDSWYVLEIAEKRAKSRVVLTMAGLYELGAYGEDESEEFRKDGEFETESQQEVDKRRVIESIEEHIERSTTAAQLQQCFSSITEEDTETMRKFNDKLLILTQ